MFGALRIRFGLQVSSDKIQSEVARLHREATKLKGIDWPGAIALLTKASVLDGKHGLWLGAATMVRLPICLQQGGQFEQSLAEFDRLIGRVPEQVRNFFTDSSELHRRAICHFESSIIYGKRRVACKREKRLDLAQNAKLAYDIHQAAWEALQPALEREDLKKTAECKRISDERRKLRRLG